MRYQLFKESCSGVDIVKCLDTETGIVYEPGDLIDCDIYNFKRYGVEILEFLPRNSSRSFLNVKVNTEGIVGKYGLVEHNENIDNLGFLPFSSYEEQITLRKAISIDFIEDKEYEAMLV